MGAVVIIQHLLCRLKQVGKWERGTNIGCTVLKTGSAESVGYPFDVDEMITCTSIDF